MNIIAKVEREERDIVGVYKYLAIFYMLAIFIKLVKRSTKKKIFHLHAVQMKNSRLSEAGQLNLASSSPNVAVCIQFKV